MTDKQQFVIMTLKEFGEVVAELRGIKVITKEDLNQRRMKEFLAEFGETPSA